MGERRPNLMCLAGRKPLALAGSMTALATPFRNGSIDEAAFKRLYERQIERGTTAFMCAAARARAPPCAARSRPR